MIYFAKCALNTIILANPYIKAGNQRSISHYVIACEAEFSTKFDIKIDIDITKQIFVKA